MAASFWTSSHASLLTTKEQLRASHSLDRARGLSEDQIQEITIFHVHYICDLARSLQLIVRQRVVATACVYFRRFSAAHDFCEYNPGKVAPACLYLACKAEEAQLQAKLMFYAMRKVSGTGRYSKMPTLDVKQLMDLEMVILEGLNYKLAIFHPYEDITVYLKDALLEDIAQCAWATVNDSYRTEACLLFPPHIIALGCLSLAAVLMQKDICKWMEDIDNVDLGQVYQVTDELIGMYESRRETITSETCHQYLNAMVQ